MITGVDIIKTKEYSLPYDKDDPTVFVLGMLSKRDNMEILHTVVNDRGGIDAEKMKWKAPDIFKAGVKAIKNMKIRDEKRDFDSVTDEAMEAVPLPVIFEIATEVVNFNFLSEDDQKN